MSANQATAVVPAWSSPSQGGKYGSHRSRSSSHYVESDQDVQSLLEVKNLNFENLGQCFLSRKEIQKQLVEKRKKKTPSVRGSFELEDLQSARSSIGLPRLKSLQLKNSLPSMEAPELSQGNVSLALATLVNRGSSDNFDEKSPKKKDTFKQRSTSLNQLVDSLITTRATLKSDPNFKTIVYEEDELLQDVNKRLANNLMDYLINFSDVDFKKEQPKQGFTSNLIDIERKITIIGGEEVCSINRSPKKEQKKTKILMEEKDFIRTTDEYEVSGELKYVATVEDIDQDVRDKEVFAGMNTNQKEQGISSGKLTRAHTSLFGEIYEDIQKTKGMKHDVLVNDSHAAYHSKRRHYLYPVDYIEEHPEVDAEATSSWSFIQSSLHLRIATRKVKKIITEKSLQVPFGRTLAFKDNVKVEAMNEFCGRKTYAQ